MVRKCSSEHGTCSSTVRAEHVVVILSSHRGNDENEKKRHLFGKRLKL
jgi:hypothetical protein